MPKLVTSLVAACLSMGAFEARAFAAQFVVTEVTYEHSATTTSDSHNRVVPSAETPASWKAPIDYATAGSVHVRLEVFTKPSTANTRFQICFEATPSYACTDQSPVYTATGVYDWETSFPKFYQYSQVDWTKGVNKVALILKDDKNGKPAPENVGDATSKLYMPTDLRVTVTVIAPGSTYIPPAPTADAGVSTDAGTVVDSPQPVTPTIPVDAGTPATAATTPASDDGGCAAAPGTTGSGLVLALAVVALLLHRRRSSER